MPHSTLAELDRQWTTIQSSPTAAAALARWAQAEPALAGLATLGAVLDRRLSDPGGARPLLAALARLAVAGEPLAIHTLFKALLPGLVAMAKGPFDDDPQALEELIALAWERIGTYPTHRAGSVAANVLWDVRKRYLCHRDIDLARNQPPLGRPGTAASAEDEALARGWVDDVREAVAAGVIGPAEVALVLRTRLHGVALADAAAEHKRSVAWAHCVRWRAEQRLRPLLAMAS